MISINALIPLLKHGWVAMDKNKVWCWYNRKPVRYRELISWQISNSVNNEFVILGRSFDIEPANDWTKSLIRVGGNDD